MDPDLLLFIAIGFFAQIIDGALGMAFGIIASSSLIAFGAPPVLASAAIHAAEIVTTGISGGSHVYNRNVEKGLFLKLVFTGVAGGVCGAYLLTGLPEAPVRIFVTCYLVAMAVLIGLRVLSQQKRHWKVPKTALGAGGGFLDAIGGGGWGPLVVSGLVATGYEPRKAIGSANLAEFFVTVSISVAFLTQLDLSSYGMIVLGLIIGGGIAAPLAGYLIRVIPQKLALVLVGLVVASQAAVSLYNLMV
jgi:uncharacterized membrane protein YfcA